MANLFSLALGPASARVQPVRATARQAPQPPGSPQREARRRLGRAWPQALALVSLATVLEAQTSRFPVRHTDTVSRTLGLGAPGDHLLEISLVNGSIHLAGDDGAEVQLAAKRTIDAETEADARTADRAVGFDIAESISSIRVHADPAHRPGCDEDHMPNDNGRRLRYRVRFDVDVRVPSGTNVRLCTVNGGAVDVTGIAGSFDVDNVNGAIRLTSMRGSGRAETVNGAVTASFVENPQSASEFKSVNGPIDVTFRRGLSADLKMKTFNGGLYTDFDVAPLPGLVRVAERLAGRLVYKADRFTLYRVGGGGPQLTFDAFNGDVRILGRD
jgi:hypothetical protein